MPGRRLNSIRLARLLALVVVAPMLLGCIGDEPAPPPFADPLSLALLQPMPYPTITIEVHHSPETPPFEAALDHLVETLALHTRKNIVLLPPQPLDHEDPRVHGDHGWRWSELDGLHRRTFTVHEPDEIGGNGTVGLHVLVLNGRFAEDSPSHSPVGLNTGNLLIFFKGSLPQKEARVIAPEIYAQRMLEVERAVLVHELGHAIGLVNRGIPMVRPHDDGDGHSRFRDSVMYPTLDVSMDLLPLLTGQDPIPDAFDAYDSEDLEAVRTAPPPRSR